MRLYRCRTHTLHLTMHSHVKPCPIRSQISIVSNKRKYNYHARLKEYSLHHWDATRFIAIVRKLGYGDFLLRRPPLRRGQVKRKSRRSNDLNLTFLLQSEGLKRTHIRIRRPEYLSKFEKVSCNKNSPGK